MCHLFWGIGQGGHFVFQIGPKNPNLVENVEILLPIKFRWIPFSVFRGEIKNASANQRPGLPSCFSDWPKNHKFGRGCWDLASCQSFVEFRLAVSEEKWKISQPIRGQGGHLVFPIGPKNTNLVEDIEIMLPVKFPWISFGSFWEVKNVSANQRPGRPSCFPIGPKNTNFVEGVGNCFLSSFVEFPSAVSEEKLKKWKVNDGQTTDKLWSQ